MYLVRQARIDTDKVLFHSLTLIPSVAEHDTCRREETSQLSLPAVASVSKLKCVSVIFYLMFFLKKSVQRCYYFWPIKTDGDTRISLTPSIEKLTNNMKNVDNYCNLKRVQIGSH